MSFAADLREVLRERDFRRLYATRLTSQASDGAFQVGLTSLFFFSPERQTSASGVAGAFTVLLLPYSVVGPFAGVLLDRWSRRQVLVWANVLRAVMVLGVAALVAGGAVEFVLYTAVLACLSVNRFFLSGLSASLPHVVPRRDLVMANSVMTTSGTIFALVGAGIGYLLGRVLGAGDAGDARLIALTALSYLVAAWLASRMHRDLLGPDLPEGERRPSALAAVHGVLAGLADGARHVWSHRPAAYALGAITVHRFSYGITTIAAFLLYRNYFYDPADVDAGLAGLALVFVSSGVGFLLAAVITPPIVDRIGMPAWIVACFVLAALTDLVYVAVLTEWLVVAGAFVIGMAAQGSKICVDTIVQRSVDDDFRGRVFSFYDVLFNMAFVSACAFAAVAVPSDGDSRAVYAVIAIGYLVAALGYGRATARLNERNARARADTVAGRSKA